MNVPWLVPLVAGPLVGVVSLLYLPRWHALDRIWQGLGILTPVIVLALLVVGVIFAYDQGPLQRRAAKAALFVAGDVGTILYVLANLRIGF